MSDTIRLSGVTLNAPDAIALARFYAVITGGVAYGNSHWATVTGPHGSLGFQQVADFRAPGWPEGAVPMQMRLDFFVDDLEASGVRPSPPEPPASTSNRTPTTAWCTPTRLATPFACPPGTAHG